MIKLLKLRSFFRRALSVPFRIDKRDAPPRATFKLISKHKPVIPSRSIEGYNEAMIGFRNQSWEFREFLATIEGPLLLDASQGWVVRDNQLLHIGNWSLLTQLPNIMKPNVLRWCIARFTARPIEQAVWLPYGAGNYWHFLNDMVSGLALLSEYENLDDYKILVSSKLAEKRFFGEFVALSSKLSVLNWTIYDHDRWLTSPRIHVVGTSFGSYSTFQRAIKFLDLLPPVKCHGDQRIFITRSPHNARSVVDAHKLAEALEDRHFKVVDFEGMSVLEQREIVNSASTIVAIHGAGLANLAFHERPKSLRLFEITPEDYLNPCFAYMAEEAGMNYFCFSGGPMNAADNARFEVPLGRFLDALDCFLTAD